MTWYTQSILGGSLKQSRSLTSILGFILGVAAVIGLVWGNYQFAEKQVSGGGFFIQWISIHSIITEGIDPYSSSVSAQIQDTVKIRNGFTNGVTPQYSSPLYSGIVIFPFAILGNSLLAHALWRSAQLIGIFLIFLLGLRLTGWKPPWYLFLIFALLTTFSYHVVIPWLDGGLPIWASLFLVISFISIRNNWDEAGGIFLALAAIEPQMVILVIIFVLIWAASHRRRLLFLWFFITLIFLSVVGILLVPDWIMQYIRLLYNYPKYFPTDNLGRLFSEIWPGLGVQLGWVVTAIAGTVLIVEWWRARMKDFHWFIWTACLTLVISQWIGIPVIPGYFTGLLLPLILVSALLTDHWPRGGQWVVSILFIILFVWEWGLLYFDIANYPVGMMLNLIIPLPLVLVIALYWVRWWAIKPRRLLIEELRYGEVY